MIPKDPETRMTAKDRQQHSATSSDYMETRLNNWRNGMETWLSERGKIANEHRIEAETKSDIQIENLINVAEFKANFMGKLYYY